MKQEEVRQRIVDAARDYRFWFTEFEKLSEDENHLKKTTKERNALQEKLMEVSAQLGRARKELFSLCDRLQVEDDIGQITGATQP